MPKASETLLALAKFNSWRRGDETLEMPPPEEIGATIDDAVNLLRRYDEMERQLATNHERAEEIIRARERTIDQLREEYFTRGFKAGHADALANDKMRNAHNENHELQN